MDKIVKISEEDLLEAVYGTYTNEEVVKWHGIEMVVKRNIAYDEVIQFVDSVVSVAFNKDDASYRPERVDFAIRAATVILYTNITLPKDIYKSYEILYQSDLLPSIIGMYIDREQLNIIVQAIHDKIDSILEVNAVKVKQQIDELTGQFNSLSDELTKFFKSMDISDLAEFVRLFENGEVDEEKIVEAVIKNND